MFKSIIAMGLGFCVSVLVTDLAKPAYQFRNSRIGIAPGADAPGVSFWGEPAAISRRSD
jgi:hypothetical protein